MKNGPMRVLSLGGGTQSSALALMSANGDLPKLDLVVFADTQGELPETYEHLRYLRERLNAARIPLVTVSAGSLEAALLGERMPANPTPPAFLTKPDGKDGRILGYKCSFDFKRRRVMRAIRSHLGRGAWKRSNVEQWIGFSSEEIGRAKPATECRCGHNLSVRKGNSVERIHTENGCARCGCERFDPWLTNHWPLIELGVQRDETIAWFGDHGHPTPPRSACWFCPNSRNGRWAALRDEHPDLFERACIIDDSIRCRGGFPDRGRQEFGEGVQLYLHDSRRPLREADLTVATERSPEGAQQLALFDDATLALDCQAGACFT